MDKSFTIDLKLNLNGTQRTKEDLLQLVKLLEINNSYLPKYTYDKLIDAINIKIAKNKCYINIFRNNQNKYNYFDFINVNFHHIMLK